ncbi:MAG: Tad domain-containing protein [Armatimonadetes bacterium]|nr:Tad domain-containing protein [Armatimonadota bacterium]
MMLRYEPHRLGDAPAARGGCGQEAPGVFQHRRTIAIRQERGAIVVTVALLLVPLLGMGGLAVDYGRGLHARAVLQEAVDGAAAGVRAYREELRGGRMGWPEIEAAARRLAVAALAANRFAGTVVWTEWQGSVLWLYARAASDTLFARVLGWSRLEVRARAAVTVPDVPPPPAVVSPPGAPPLDEGTGDIHRGPESFAEVPSAPGPPGLVDVAPPSPGIPAPDSPPPEVDMTPPAEPPSPAAGPATSSGPAATRGGDDWLVAGTDFAYVKDSSGEEYGLNTRTGATERLGGTPSPDAISDAYRGSGNSSPATPDYGGCDDLC